MGPNGYHGGPTDAKPTACRECKEEFRSRTDLFKHLKDTSKTCPAEYEGNDYDAGEKVLITFGYSCNEELGVVGCDDAATLLCRAMNQMGPLPQGGGGRHSSRLSCTSASSVAARGCALVKQEDGVHAMADTACLRASTVPPSQVPAWVRDIDTRLTPSGLRVFGRMKVPGNFHAEIHVTKRRYEYLLPAWLVDPDATGPWSGEPRGHPALAPLSKNLRSRTLKWFAVKGEKGRPRPRWHNFSAGAVPHSPLVVRKVFRFCSHETLVFRGVDFFCLSISGDGFLEQQVRAMVGLAVALSRGLVGTVDHRKVVAKCIDPESVDALLPIPLAPPGVCFLAENGYSQWQPKLQGVTMSPGAWRSRGTVGYGAGNKPGFCDDDVCRAYDGWRRELLDQAAERWGKGELGEKWLREVLEPGAGKLRKALAGVGLDVWWVGPVGTGRDEDKEACDDATLTLKSSKRGVGDEEVERNQGRISESLGSAGRGVVSPVTTALQGEEREGEGKGKGEEGIVWDSCSTISWQVPLPPPRRDEAPEVYREVLRLLREADASGRWPASSQARQAVIHPSSWSGVEKHRNTANATANAASPPLAPPKARREDRREVGTISSPVRVNEGGDVKSEGKGKEGDVDFKGGGTSNNDRNDDAPATKNSVEGGGSFTVGYFPPPCPHPRGNTLFPELVVAAFALEAALLPGRPPSSTIAINRHARFQPHTDSGDGAGQSLSLIVGLGDYSGGGLVVEGQASDVRYRPLEFNGWKERHWTLPFAGERYTLVWFTPRGCEGLAGAFLEGGRRQNEVKDPKWIRHREA